MRLLTIDKLGLPVSILKSCLNKLDVRALKYLPQAFNGPEVSMDEATSKFLDVFFTNKRKQAYLLPKAGNA